jgi:hypothetical protein
MNIDIELTEKDFTALVGLLDIAIKSTGLRSVSDAAKLLTILDTAYERAKNNVKTGNDQI